jgi:glycosyltransferase involved in cell wall biosynthesis
VFHLHGAEWRAAKWNPIIRVVFFISCLVGVGFSQTTVTVCEATHSTLGRWLPWKRRHVKLVPNGRPVLNGSVASQLPVFDCRFVLYAGRLVPQKRLDLLLHAFRESASAEHLVIAGASSHTDEHFRALRRLDGDDPSIHWVGQLDRATLSEAYRRCVALVLCSDVEGCSNVLLEALVAGCCIIVSDLPENLSVVGDGARTFRRGDLGDLAFALRDILSDPDEAERLRHAAMRRVAALPTWDEVATQFLRLYAEVAEVGERLPAVE